MIKDRKYTLTIELLKSYKENAIKNSILLIGEAKILLNNKMLPGAYFLACVSIEEGGKALLAFNSVNRNLSNPAVQHVLKMEFETHSAKIVMGLSSLMRKGGTGSENVDYFLDLDLDLYAGREKSLYADINDDNTLTLPETLVPPEVASDSVRLAENALAATIDYISRNQPPKFSNCDDKAYVVSKQSGFQKMMSMPDFLKFYMDIMKSMQYNSEDHFSVTISRYWDEYFSKRKLWGETRSSLSTEKQ